MLKQHHRFFRVVFQVFDLFLVALAWLWAFPIRFIWLRNFIPVIKGYPTYHQYAYLSFFIIVLWYIIFHVSGVYRNRRTQSPWPEIITITRASALGFLV